MRIKSVTAHYFAFGWSAAMLKKTHRTLAVAFHPDRASASERERFTRIMQDVNAEHDFMKLYPGAGAIDDSSSVFQMTGQHLVDLNPAAQAEAAQAAASAQAAADRAAREQARAEQTAREQAAQAEREARQREAAAQAERVNAERRQRAAEEAARFVPGSAPTAETPRYRVKQQTMF